MKAVLTLATASVSAVLLALSLASAARADDEPHRLGDHPAVVVQRLYKAAGYDYASKFYAHPAGLYLYAAQPRDAGDSATTQREAAPAPIDSSIARTSGVAPKVNAHRGG